MATQCVMGCEVLAPVSSTGSIDNPTTGPVTGTVTRDVTKQRSGGGCYKFDSTVGNAASFIQVGGFLTDAANKIFYVRSYFCFDALPGSTIAILSNVSVCSARLTSAGKLQLFNENTGTQIGGNSVETIAADGVTYYRVEMAVTTDASTGGNAIALELRLNGTTVASTTGLSFGRSSNVNIGWITAPGASKVCYADDIKCNDSTGANNNTWPGSGKIILMLPISDNNRGAWTQGAGAGGTTNLWNAVNNIPPAGAADASATSTTQIKNRTTTNPSNCDLNLDSYTGAGIGASDTVNFVELWANHGEDPGTGTKAGTVTIVSNPASSAGSSFNFGDDVGTQGTYVGNWRWNAIARATVDGPTVALGTAVVVRITCTSGATGSRSASCDFLGMIVEYTPAVSGTTSTKAGFGKENG